MSPACRLFASASIFAILFSPVPRMISSPSGWGALGSELAIRVLQRLRWSPTPLRRRPMRRARIPDTRGHQLTALRAVRGQRARLRCRPLRAALAPAEILEVRQKNAVRDVPMPPQQAGRPGRGRPPNSAAPGECVCSANCTPSSSTSSTASSAAPTAYRIWGRKMPNSALFEFFFSSFRRRRASHFEVLTPYEGEIFDQEDVYFELRLHGHLADAVKSGAHEILVGINGNEAMRTVPRQGCPRQPVFMLVDAFLDACT